MELSTSLNILHDYPANPIETTIKRIASIGFKHIDMNFCDWCFEDSPFVGRDWERWIDSALAAATAAGVAFTQAHGPIFYKWDDTDECRRMKDLSHRSLLAAGKLGISWVVFEPETANGAWDDNHVATLRRRNVEWFSPLVETAEKSGTGIALENCTDQHARQMGSCRWYGSIPSELISLIDAFAARRVGACWDTGHAHIQGLDQPAALRALGSRLKALHIQDNNGREDQHLAPYYGSVKWTPLVEALREIDYPHEFTFEAHNFVRGLPDSLRESALRLLFEIGTRVVSSNG